MNKKAFKRGIEKFAEEYGLGEQFANLVKEAITREELERIREQDEENSSVRKALMMGVPGVLGTIGGGRLGERLGSASLGAALGLLGGGGGGLLLDKLLFGPRYRLTDRDIRKALMMGIPAVAGVTGGAAAGKQLGSPSLGAALGLLGGGGGGLLADELLFGRRDRQEIPPELRELIRKRIA